MLSRSCLSLHTRTRVAAFLKHRGADVNQSSLDAADSFFEWRKKTLEEPATLARPVIGRDRWDNSWALTLRALNSWISLVPKFICLSEFSLCGRSVSSVLRAQAESEVSACVGRIMLDHSPGGDLC